MTRRFATGAVMRTNSALYIPPEGVLVALLLRKKKGCLLAHSWASPQPHSCGKDSEHCEDVMTTLEPELTNDRARREWQWLCGEVGETVARATIAALPGFDARSDRYCYAVTIKNRDGNSAAEDRPRCATTASPLKAQAPILIPDRPQPAGLPLLAVPLPAGLAPLLPNGSCHFLPRRSRPRRAALRR